MTGRHWIRKDVLLPIGYLVLFGGGFYWLYRRLLELPETSESDVITWILRMICVLYLLLIVITIRHVFTSYDLERYDPGNPASLKRLMRRTRYKLRRRPIPAGSLIGSFEQQLLTAGYRLETESHMIGRVYHRVRPALLFWRQQVDRVMLLQHEPLNVIMVDIALQECIRYVRNQVDRPSKRNLLILVTRMNEAEEMASAAAGVVNFLGKFNGGTLGVLLLATRQSRLFYPADRTLMPRTHRWFQNRLHWTLKFLIHRLQSTPDIIVDESPGAGSQS